MALLAGLADLGMAIGPSLVYADQCFSIAKRKDSTGFSKDVCGVIILANIARVFFWVANRFEKVLLVQSLLLIISQTALLYICLRFSPPDDTESGLHPNRLEEERHITLNRPFGFWQWAQFGTYIDFLAAYAVVNGLLLLVLHSIPFFVAALGFFALFLEATLPVPQLLTNYQRKSLAGFRTSVLAGWVFGDGFKLLYFLLRGTTWQFSACAVFQLSVDCAIVAQLFVYGKN